MGQVKCVNQLPKTFQRQLLLACSSILRTQQLLTQTWESKLAHLAPDRGGDGGTQSSLQAQRLAEQTRSQAVRLADDAKSQAQRLATDAKGQVEYVQERGKVVISENVRRAQEALPIKGKTTTVDARQNPPHIELH